MKSLCFLIALAFLTQVYGQELQPQVAAALQATPHPSSPAQFKTSSHLPCLNQGQTSICWSYATSSFIESEMARLNMEPVRLSVVYPTYHAFLDKARRFVQTKGTSRFAPGDLFTGWIDAARQYGAIPASSYENQTHGKLLNHSALYAELDKFIASVKQKQNWDEAAVVGTVQQILDRHLGQPPTTIQYKGNRYTPRSFTDQVLRLPWS